MTHPDPRTFRRPAQRRDESTRPSTAPSRTRRSTDRGPYPTAPAARPAHHTRSPRQAAAGSRTPDTASAPTPATVWPAGPAPIDLDTTWPTPILTRIITSFSPPGGKVTLLPWPDTNAQPRLRAVGPRRRPKPGPDPVPHIDLADAATALGHLHRTVAVMPAHTSPTRTDIEARRFQAALVNSDGPTGTAQTPERGLLTDVPGRGPVSSTDVDLIITSVRPEHHTTAAGDVVTLLAVRMLHTGGILAVLTHSDWSAGDLTDPTGSIVASAQNADLLYLQHIVALHAPIHDGQFTTDTSSPDTTADRHAGRGDVQRRPRLHDRIHSDVLVFANPRDPDPSVRVSAERPTDTGARR